MCGIVGLFTGCPLVKFCPSSLGQQEVTGKDVTYKSRFKNWDSRSSVRAKPRHRLAISESKKLNFSPDYVPIAKHPLICALDKQTQEEILTQHLYRYLDFTDKLEYLVVNRVAMSIAYGQLDVGLPQEMILDAYRIYVDEAYHGLFSRDLAYQVQNSSGVKPRLLWEPYFLKRLSEIKSRLSSQQERDLAEIFFVIVSETLISSTLAQIPKDGRVISAVREVVSDHAEDEGRHHAYFAHLLRVLWPKLNANQQKVIGKLLPEFIFAFLSPDLDSLRFELSNYPLSTEAIEEVLADTFKENLVLDSTKRAGQATLSYFEQSGVFANSEIRDAFCARGLL